ncbi:hypothetical protein BH10ACT6_BH10ACT6_12730 [soil metagenome]
MDRVAELEQKLRKVSVQRNLLFAIAVLAASSAGVVGNQLFEAQADLRQADQVLQQQRDQAETVRLKNLMLTSQLKSVGAACARFAATALPRYPSWVTPTSPDCKVD